MTTTVFRNALVVDGLGSEPVMADVHVAQDQILDVTEPGARASAREVDREIDLDGLVLAPGFIDMHSHSDLQILSDPQHLAKVSQGITTEVLGQDGLSYAPVDDASLALLKDQLRGWNGDPEGFDWNWRSVAQYLERLDGTVPVNTAYLVPHGNLRLMTMGAAERVASPNELDAMCALLRQCLAEGAVGLSAGLTYVPGMYADTDELVALNEVVAEAGGYFSPHHRNYGSAAIEAYQECFEIAERSGVALHLAHAHLSFEVNRGRLPELLHLMDDAVKKGVDFSFDSYPYLAGMTTLVSQLPGWAQTGGTEEVLRRLKDPTERARIIEALDVTGSDGHQGLTVDWSTVFVAGVPGAPELHSIVGSDLATVAGRADRKPAEFCLDVLIATALGAPCVIFMGFEEHVRELMRHPAHTVGSDGILVGDKPHPRSWGTFPRMLQVYVREEGVLTLAECVRHMTSSAADRIGLSDRGRVVPGAKADLVVFDQWAVSTPATYEDPRQQATGISHVMVNGEFVLERGTITGLRTGRVLTRNIGPRVRGRHEPKELGHDR